MGATYWALRGRGECLQTLGDAGEGITIVMINNDHFCNPLFANVVHKTWSAPCLKNYIFSLMLWNTVYLEKLIFPQIVKKFSALCGISRFISVCTRTHHLSLFWARWINSMPSDPFSLRYILMLFSVLCFDLQKSLLPSGFLTRIPY